eukprot:gnl/Chilomastix_cuspidata/373.p1 GENE.gnl/Chilomastix_cuspidata/373~~gnl/Chilomastix_cuspidata/373.p1  ORF type:complete len:500 (-),score=197.96 gnl/Chilomastix_cuspidata/373:421-1716(-)
MSITIDDITGTESTSIGDIKYSLTDITIQNFDISEIEYATNPEDNTVLLSLNNNSLTITFSYSYQLLSWPYSSEEGTGAIDSEGVTMSIVVSGARFAETGEFTYNVESLVTTIDDINVHLDGGALATIVDILVGIIGDSLADVVSALITEELLALLTEYAEKGTDFLSGCIYTICQDMRLAADTEVLDNSLSQNFGGVYYASGDDDAELPTDFTDLPRVIDDHMIQTLWGPAVFTSYFSAVYTDGRFDAVTSALQSADSIAQALPEFAAAFPGEGAYLGFTLAAAPTSRIMYSALEVTFDTTLSVAPESAPDTPALVLRLDSVTAGDVDFITSHFDDAPVDHYQEAVSVVLSAYDTAVEVQESSIGDVELTDALGDWANAAFFDEAVDGAWQSALDKYHMRIMEINDFLYTNRAITYTPDYVGITFDLGER